MSMIKRTYITAEDKRKYARVPFSAEALLLILDDHGDVSIQTRIRDITFAGIGISSPAPVDTGTKVAIKIVVNDQEERAVVEGMVAWSIDLEDGHDLGIYFSHPIDREIQPHLFDIISTGLIKLKTFPNGADR